MTVLVRPPVGHPVTAALDGIADLVEGAVDAPLWSLSALEVAELTVQAAACEARLRALLLVLVGEADRRDVASAVGASSTAAWLGGAGRLRAGTATNLVRDARAVGSALPLAAAALREGSLNAEQVSVVRRAVGDLGGASAAARADAERLLVAAGDVFGPVELARLGRRKLEIVDPAAADRAVAQGLERDERAAHARRRLSLVPTGLGSTLIRGEVDTECAARIAAVLDPLAAPRPADADGPDLRSGPQRYADALDEAMRRLLADAVLPGNGGEPPQVVVTVDYQMLRDAVGAATLPDTGDAVTPRTARRLACDATIIPVVLGGPSQPLDVGRQARLVTTALRRALVLRDRGCAFPGCDRPPRWADAHHIRHWVDGGPTSLPNLVLLCGHHHRVIHHGDWAVTTASDGRPDFIPPRWLDPDQKPRRNPRRRD